MTPARKPLNLETMRPILNEYKEFALKGNVLNMAAHTYTAAPEKSLEDGAIQRASRTSNF